MTKKKRKKKRGFLFLGFLVSAVTIAIGAGGKAEGKIVEPDKPGKSKEQLCLEAGGVFDRRTQMCKFPAPVGCGPMPLIPSQPPGGFGGYLVNDPFGVNKVEWFVDIKFRNPSAIVLLQGGFSNELLTWVKCKYEMGELP